MITFDNDNVPCEGLTDLFFPEARLGYGPWLEATAAATKTCGRCSVRLKCLRYAITAAIPVGTMGGMTDNQRTVWRWGQRVHVVMAAPAEVAA